MPLFTRIPQRFFTILTSTKKELYVEALFVLRQAFKTELVIRREELTAMLRQAGFSQIRIFGELKMRPPVDGEQRVFFTARKDK